MNNKIKIAIDTNCLNTKKKSNTPEKIILNELESLWETGKIELITTTVHETEQMKSNPNHCQRHLKTINKKHKVSETMRYPIKLGISVFSDLHKDNKLGKIFKDWQKESPNNFIDFHMLETAIHHKCDYFLTMDKKAFLKNEKRKTEIEKMGIQLRYPEQVFLENLLKQLKSNDS